MSTHYQTDKHALYSLYCASALHGMIHTLSLFLSPLNVEIAKYFQTDSIATITSFKTAYLVVYAASNLLFGALTHRIPVRQTLALGMGVNALAITLFYIIPTTGIPFMYGLWILAAIGGGVYHPVANVFITRKFPHRKGWALGITGIGSGIGFAFGPLITGALSRLGLNWQSIALLFGILGILAAFVAFRVIRDDGQDLSQESLDKEGGRTNPRSAGPLRPQEPVVADIPGGSMAETLCPAEALNAQSESLPNELNDYNNKYNNYDSRLRPPTEGVLRPAGLPGGLTWPLLGFLTWMILLTASREISMWSILDISAFFLQVSVKDPSAASWYLFLMYLPGIITQPFVGAWSDTWGRRGLALLTFGVFGVCLAVLPFLPPSLLFLPYFFMGATQSASVPLVEAMIADYTTPKNRGMMFGVFITAIMGLGALGPFISGAWLDGVGRSISGFQILFSLFGGAVFLGGVGLYFTPRMVKFLGLSKN
ncbi:MAG: MFS transporter [Spirochaetales bacterium]